MRGYETTDTLCTGKVTQTHTGEPQNTPSNKINEKHGKNRKNQQKTANLCLHAFRSLANLKLNFLVFLECAEARANNLGEVHEHIAFAVVARHETVTLRVQKRRIRTKAKNVRIKQLRELNSAI